MIRGHMVWPAYENVATGTKRDISHSSAERTIWARTMPIDCSTVSETSLEVHDPGAGSTFGLIFSQRAMLTGVRYDT